MIGDMMIMILMIMTVISDGDHGDDNNDGRTIHLGSQGAGQAGPHSTKDRTRRRQLVDAGETSHSAHLHCSELACRISKDKNGLLFVGEIRAGKGGKEGG